MITFLIVCAVLAALALLLFLVYLLVLVRPRGKKPSAEGLLCDYAHRGLHGNGVPENSLAAFALACEAKAGIELDVQLSSDGVVMVFHDYTLIRMTGCDKKVSELTARELQALSLSQTEQRIPTLAEVLKLVDGRVPLLVELKGESLDTSLCERVAEQLKAYRGAYCIESFNPLLVRGIKKYLPDAFCGLLYTNLCREKKKASALNIVLSLMALNVLARPHFIAYHQEDRNGFPVRLATGFYRAPKFVWTVRKKEDVALAHSLGECPIFEGIE